MQTPDRLSNKSEKRWVTVQSDLAGADGRRKDIQLEIMEDGMPRAMAFFDIDGTLAHLSLIHGRTIVKIFPDADPKELEETFYRGFKLGNSFREFDRMKGIYADGHSEWKDPETYLKERFASHSREIDEPGNPAHDIAAAILKAYGEAAAEVADDIYKQAPEKFENSNIAPIFLLARLYSRLGIPIVGFTANARVLVERLAKYLKLSDIFIDIATDETMAGGGKEIAVMSLMKKIAEKGIAVPKDRLVFVGDSLRGDIGIYLKLKAIDPRIDGQGILVLENKADLIDIKRQISENPELRRIADSIGVHALVVKDVPLDEKGKPMLVSRYRGEFLEKL